MKKRISSIFLGLLTALAVLIGFSPAYALYETDQTISGNQTFNDDVKVNYKGGHTFGAVVAGYNETIRVDKNKYLEIQTTPDFQSSYYICNGLTAWTGGKIDVGKVIIGQIIDGQDKSKTTVTFGIEAAGGDVIVGDNSTIYAFRGESATAVSAGDGGSVIIGNNATLHGNNFGDGGVVTASYRGGTIRIGNDADILNDGSHTQTYVYLHMAVSNMYGGDIYIGDNANIRVHMPQETAHSNAAVYADNYGGSNQPAGSNSYIKLGNNAQIDVNSNYSFGVYATH